MELKNVRMKMHTTIHQLVHSSVNPTEEEWTANLNSLTEHKARIQGIFVYTMGGAPNAAQRDRYNKTLEKIGLKPKVAILNGSAMIRGIVTAFNWIQQGNDMKMYPLDGLKDALAYLGCSPTEGTVLTTQLDKFKMELKL
jgi:hypothetical protein